MINIFEKIKILFTYKHKLIKIIEDLELKNEELKNNLSVARFECQICGKFEKIEPMGLCNECKIKR